MKTSDLIEAMLNKMAAYDPSVSVIRPVGAKMYTARLLADFPGDNNRQPLSEDVEYCPACGANDYEETRDEPLPYREAEGHTPDAAITHLYAKVCGRAMATAEAP